LLEVGLRWLTLVANCRSLTIDEGGRKKRKKKRKIDFLDKILKNPR